MKRRTLLKSLGLGLCTALLGLWPDLGGRGLSVERERPFLELLMEAWEDRRLDPDFEFSRSLATDESFEPFWRTATPSRWSAT